MTPSPKRSGDFLHRSGLYILEAEVDSLFQSGAPRPPGGFSS